MARKHSRHTVQLVWLLLMQTYGQLLSTHVNHHENQNRLSEITFAENLLCNSFNLTLTQKNPNTLWKWPHREPTNHLFVTECLTSAGHRKCQGIFIVYLNLCVYGRMMWKVTPLPSSEKTLMSPW